MSTSLLEPLDGTLGGVLEPRTEFMVSDKS